MTEASKCGEETDRLKPLSQHEPCSRAKSRIPLIPTLYRSLERKD